MNELLEQRCHACGAPFYTDAATLETKPRKKKRYGYVLGVLIGLDQFINAIFAGDPDETISSRIGRKKLRYGGRIPFWKHPLEASIDWLLERIDANHCIEAIGE